MQKENAFEIYQKRPSSGGAAVGAHPSAPDSSGAGLRCPGSVSHPNTLEARHWAGAGAGGGRAGLEEGVSPTPKTQRQDNHLSAPVDPQPSLPEISRPKNLKENSGIGKRWGGGQLNENKREEPALVMGQTISIFGVRQNGRGLMS